MREKGFTVIELLFVIAVVSIISALMAPVMLSVRKKALVVKDHSNLHQINIYFESYAIENYSYIPRMCDKFKTLGDEERLRDEQGIPSLKGLIAKMARTDPVAMKLLICPADTGATVNAKEPCWKKYGQSYEANMDMFKAGAAGEENGPGYNPNGDGPMYGANPVKRDDSIDPSKYIALCDIRSYWHGGTSLGEQAQNHFINILYFDGHVAGKGFETSLEAEQYAHGPDTTHWWP